MVYGFEVTVLYVSRDVNVHIDDVDGEYSVQAQFPDIVPVTEEMEKSDPERAARIYRNLDNSMYTRFDVFCRVFNLIARTGTIDHWKELDVCFTSLVMLLEEKGLDGALECIKPAIERTTGVAAGSNIDDPKGFHVR